MISRSKSSQSSDQYSETNVRNLNVQDVEGITLVESSGNQIVTTDHGALAAALDVGTDALRLGEYLFRDASALAGRGLDNALDATRGALALGERAIDAQSDLADRAMREIAMFGGTAIGEVRSIAVDTTRDALDAVTGAQEGVLDFARDLFGGVLDAFGGALNEQGRLTEQNIAGLTALARQTSESADDRVTRTAGYAFAAIGVVMLVILLRGMKT